MRVLVTGSSGFIGAACVAALRTRGLDIFAPTSRDLDVLDDSSVQAYLADVRPTHLLHAAWRPVYGDVMASDENEMWRHASFGLVRCFHDAGGERAAILGSCTEYDWRQDVCRIGKTPLSPASPYGAAKLGLYRDIAAYADASGLSWVWPRIFFVYGPGEHESRLCAYIVKQLLSGAAAGLTHGKQVRDYVYVDDVAEGVVMALLSEFQGDTDIASGAGRSLREIAAEFGAQLGASDLLRFGARNAPSHDAPVVVGDPRHARRNIGWAATTPLANGVAATINWAREAFAA